MNKIIKALILVVLLGVPVAIFLFLRAFGTNRFDVDIFYKNGVDSTFVNNCTFPEGQFHVPVEFLFKPDQSINVIGFSKGEPSMAFVNMAKRINELFSSTEVKIELISETAVKTKDYHLFQVTTDNLKQVMNCNFVLADLGQLVLVDNEGRIRGYYKTDLDEIDRLVVEIKILLENKGDE